MNMQKTRMLPAVVAIGATALVLSGCAGGSGTSGSLAGAPPLGTTSSGRQAAGHPSVQRGGLVAWRPDLRPPWMSPDAKSQTLLYVSDIATASVQVFTYPGGSLAGTLTGFNFLQGECADASGNVYIADAGNAVIDEYAHGGTTPIATFADPNAWPASCAIDPTSGNLAVANLLTSQNFEGGNVAIYPKGGGTATIYTDPTETREYFLDFDSSGNIYVAGVSGQTGYFRYAMMAPSGSFTAITVKGAKIGFAGGVQRDGGNMAVVDQQGAILGKPDIYRISPSGKAVGHTTLLTSSGARLVDPVQIAIVPKGGRSDVVTADALGAAVYRNAFPRGTYVSSYTTNLVQPLGIAISTASGG